MKRPSPIIRIAFGLSCLASAIILTAASFELVPDTNKATAKQHRIFAEMLAIDGSLFISQGNVNAIGLSLRQALKRNPDLLMARLTKANGKRVVQVASDSFSMLQDESQQVLVSVPIVSGKRDWGTLDLAFQPTRKAGFFGWLSQPMVKLLTFFSIGSFACFFFYMRSTLKYLDPSKVMPGRVRQALDTLADGLMIIDNHERIVHTNEAFQKLIGLPDVDLRGRDASKLPWRLIDNIEAGVMPWTKTLQNASVETGARLGLTLPGQGDRTFLVNSSSIVDDKAASRGALVSLDDVTDLESSRNKLRQMLDQLEESQEDIQRKNQELEHIARTDPLTSCMNRRAFYSDFETAWNTSSRAKSPLSCAMVDVDHFKSVNDRFGHATGDAVLQAVAKAIQASVRDCDLVCRYGGEEFCILMPDTDVEGAAMVAERTRQAVAQIDGMETKVTASLGISSREGGVNSPAELLDRADQALYHAKEQGRNRVIRWAATDSDADQPVVDSVDTTTDQTEAITHISFSTVSALTTALDLRDPHTAEHSKRVADLCVTVAKGLLPPSEVYTLEVAALLHDIGKIGIPDAVLHKPGKLNDEEWRIMRTHDQMRVTIMRAAGASDELLQLIRTHSARYSANVTDPSMPSGDDIPLGSRILAIAVAYDSMVNGAVYRKAQSAEAAFKELRANAGTQFDPEMVERFIQEVIANDTVRDGQTDRINTRSLDAIANSVDELIHALESEDAAAIGNAAWRIKGIAARNGSQRMIKLAEKLETLAAQNQDSGDISACATDLIEICTTANNQVKRSAPSTCNAP